MDDYGLLSEQLFYNGANRADTAIRLISYNADKVMESIPDDFATAVPALDPASVHWVRVHGLRDTERIRSVCAAFGIDFLVVQDILNVEHPSKVEEYEKFNFIVAKSFADGTPTHVALIQGSNFVMSFADSETAVFDAVMNVIAANVLKIRTRTADYLLTVLLNSLVTRYIFVAAAIDDELDELETDLIASSADRDIGAQIQSLRRRYMELKRAVVPLKEQYAKLLRTDSGLVRKPNRPFFNDVNDHLFYVVQSIDGCRETLSSLMDLYISNNDLRMNDIMKRLTVVSTIFIPLTFLVGVWGMNFEFMPELGWRYGYLAAWAVMLVIGIAVFLFLRSKRWR